MMKMDINLMFTAAECFPVFIPVLPCTFRKILSENNPDFYACVNSILLDDFRRYSDSAGNTAIIN